MDARFNAADMAADATSTSSSGVWSSVATDVPANAEFANNRDHISTATETVATAKAAVEGVAANADATVTPPLVSADSTTTTTTTTSRGAVETTDATTITATPQSTAEPMDVATDDQNLNAINTNTTDGALSHAAKNESTLSVVTADAKDTITRKCRRYTLFDGSLKCAKCCIPFTTRLSCTLLSKRLYVKCRRANKRKKAALMTTAWPVKHALTAT